VLTYSCAGNGPGDLPTYLNQSTQLWDAAPLIPSVPNEPSFHTIIPQLCEYDYSQLVNSTLVCIGTIGTLPKGSVFTLYNLATFETTVLESIPPPEAPEFDAWWVYSTSLDSTWDVYRVETAGGAVPASCQGQNAKFELIYAAEYWFYHD